MKFCTFVVACATSAWACTTLLGQDSATSKQLLNLATQKVIVFKDGHCLFHKSGVALSDKTGEVYTDDVPDSAVLGSFWAIPKTGNLVSARAGWDTVSTTVTKEVPATGFLDVLLANLGKRVRLEMNDKDVHTGTIHSVMTQPTSEALTPVLADVFGVPAERVPGTPAHALAAALPNAPLSIKRIADGSTTYVVTGVAGTQFILRTEEGDRLLQAGNIKSLLISDMKDTLSRTLTTTEKTKRLTFRLDQPEKERAIDLLYFRPGIRWIPTYRINLSNNPDQKFAAMALQAEILNEAEPLKDVPLDIVVGVPNFRFQTVPSPLVLEQVLRNTLAVAAPQLMNNADRNDFSNSLYVQRSGEFRRGAAAANAAGQAGAIDLPNELTAAGAQDLFVYNLPKLSLATGERMAVNIFNTDKVPYKDIYTWDLRVTRDDIESAPSGAGVVSPLKLPKNEVWHQVDLTNNTNLPWTTGAAMLMQGQQPLSQELLTYTSPQDFCRVPVTVSIETRGSYNEQEVGRDLKALAWEGYQYAKIDKQGHIHLCNNKNVAIDVEISIRLGGKVTEASHEGKITLGSFDATDWNNYRGHPAVNNSALVTWKLTLKPGETFEPVVKYNYYSRIN
jgi:hypothetical protein